MSMRERLQADLKQALKDKDRTAARTVRSILGEIANAEAVTPAEVGPASAAPLGRVGLSQDVPRRDLTEEDVLEILRADVRERRSALADYDAHGQSEGTERMRAELEVLARYVDVPA